MDTPFPFPSETDLSRDLLRFYRGLLEDLRRKTGAPSICEIGSAIDRIKFAPDQAPYESPTLSALLDDLDKMKAGSFAQIHPVQVVALRTHLRKTLTPIS